MCMIAAAAPTSARCGRGLPTATAEFASLRGRPNCSMLKDIPKVSKEKQLRALTAFEQWQLRSQPNPRLYIRFSFLFDYFSCFLALPFTPILFVSHSLCICQLCFLGIFILLYALLSHKESTCRVELLEHGAACTKKNMCLDLAPQVDALAFRTRLEFSHCQHRKQKAPLRLHKNCVEQVCTSLTNVHPRTDTCRNEKGLVSAKVAQAL